ncbi:MAG: MFS transporter [Caldisphaera sp.]
MAKFKNFRYIVIALSTIIFLVSYMDRVNLSIAVLQIGPEFHLSTVEIGLLSSMFFVGYMIFQIPGGIWTEKYGPRKIMTLAFSWWTTFTILMSAGISFAYILTVRTFFGFGEAPLFPGNGNLYARWLRKDEQTIGWSWSLAGMGLGPILGTIFSTYIMLNYGWQWIFIIFGVIGFFVAIGFYAVVKDMPEESKYVSKEEIEKINSSYKDPKNERGKTTKEYAPWKKLIASGRFWAYGFTHFISSYVVYGFLTLLPLYLVVSRHFSKASLYWTGTMPWVAFIIAMLVGGYFIDKALSKGYTLFKAKAIPSSIAFFLAAIFLILGAYSPTPILVVMWLSFGLAMQGIHGISVWSLGANMAPKFSGSYGGFMNTVATSAGIIAPILTTVIATYLGWDSAIAFMGILCIIGAILWLVMKPDKSFVPDLIPSYVPETQK